MSRNYKINRKRKRGPVLLPTLVLICIAALLSLVIAGVWQALSGDGIEDTSSSEGLEDSPVSSASSVVSSKEALSSEASSLEEASSEPEPPSDLEGAVAESARVKNDYFDDAAFVGDSLTTGIELYQVMSNATVLAGKGLNLTSIHTEPVVKQEDGSRITVMEALAQEQFNKIYIMMGGNEVRDGNESVFISRYTKLLDEVQKLQPDALIYVQSMLPVTEQNNYKLDNARIDSFNEALAQLCKEKEVFYVNVAESMKDDRGMLPEEASPADGMHIGPDYYNKWFEYLRTHTVPS